MAAHGSYFIIASIADRNRAYSTASDRQVIVGFFMGNVPIFANYRAKSNAIGGDGEIRTLGTDVSVRRFSKPLVSATHPRLRIAAAKARYSDGW